MSTLRKGAFPMSEALLTAKQKTLLLFIWLPTSGSGESWASPIRIMKGLFIFSQKTPPHWLENDSLYHFEPYLYGPCSFDVYADLRELVTEGYLSAAPAPGCSWNYYFLTEKGKKASDEIRASLDAKALDYLRRIKNFVRKLSFSELLKVVYQNFPEYATKSVFRP
jgi:uncharacterized protein YwgA